MATINIRPWSITVIAVLMIGFGIAEVATGFNHEFFGLTTREGTPSTIIGASLGLLYFAAGCLILTSRRWWAAQAAIGCLVLDVIGRLVMVVSGLFPIDSPKQIVSIAGGTALAALFAAYIWWKRRVFDE